MSYEDTKCPCGGKKPCQTLLCDTCLESFKDHPAMRAFNTPDLANDHRRNAAIILITVARNRKQTKPTTKGTK